MVYLRGYDYDRLAFLGRTQCRRGHCPHTISFCELSRVISIFPLCVGSILEVELEVGLELP